ncbi:hypothetical protein GCM10025857_09570 [Alicyclobacillus contaminans]|uniref:dihydroneopterin aldolase n=1 Tax=Alicyclobacillus contaminans TaxID=392016 RepID=UPI000404F4CE|nr:dihydroneopterin aldolase [Alicyclobacillus contaminans]GMA49600.1 hypothetical protein GCM10025857_09570 [Alicyclobacillus contaminans]
MTDAIHLAGIVAYGYHGALPEERRLGQRFSANVTLFLDLQRAAASDRLEDTVNYAEVYTVVQSLLAGPPRSLLEKVAGDIADALLRDFPLLCGVRVTVEKPSAPIPGPLANVSVTIERWRETP